LQSSGTAAAASRDAPFDPEAHRAELMGWDRELTEVGPGPLKLEWCQLLLRDVVVARQRLSIAVAERSSVARGRARLVLAPGAASPARWCGLEVRPAHAVIIGALQEVRAILPAGFRSIEVIVPADAVPGLGAADCDPPGPTASPHIGVLHWRSAAETGWELLKAALFDDPARSGAAHGDTGWVEARRAELLACLRPLAAQVTHRVPGDGARRIAGYATAARAMECIDRNAGRLRRVDEVAARLDIGTRQLQVAFRSYVGTTPHHYILVRKLHLARSRLVRPADPRRPIAEAATHAGFAHLGRFSEYYHRLFGELPGHTLSRVKQTRR
jgi:AraC family transcriptional regulator, ethanolamine operon transcriptional activator